MKCPVCNTELKNDKNPFCMRCGYLESNKITDVIELDKVEAKKRRHYLFNKYFFPTICLMIFLLLGYLAISTERKKVASIKSCSEIKANALNLQLPTNFLYKSDERLYNSLLSDIEKKYYRTLLDGINNFREDILIDLSELKITQNFKRKEVLERVIYALKSDHPELIQLNKFEYDSDEDKTYITVKYYFIEGEMSKRVSIINNEINSIVEDTNKLNDVEKVLKVYEWIADNIKIGEHSSAYSVFDNYLEPSNEAIAKASQMIFQRLDIDSIIVYYVRGDKKLYRNMVRINNNFYNFNASRFDSTQEPIENEISYSGFLYSDTFSNVEYRKSIPYAFGSYKFKKNSN